MASKPAARDTALLTPDAVPASSCNTDHDRGGERATVMAMPRPSTHTAGKNPLQQSAPTEGTANSA